MLDRGASPADQGAGALNGYASEKSSAGTSVLYRPDRQPPPERARGRGAPNLVRGRIWHLRRMERYCGDDIIRRSVTRTHGVFRDRATPLRGSPCASRPNARAISFALFSGFPNLVWRSDAQGSCDYLNQAGSLRGSRGKRVGSGWMEGMRDDHAPWRATFDRAYGAMQPFEIEFRLRRANARVRIHDLRGVRIAMQNLPGIYAPATTTRPAVTKIAAKARPATRE
jgi:PAS domain-containing protein